MSDLLEFALIYAGIGLAVFPVSGKKPLLGSHGFKDASKDPEEIRELFDDPRVTGIAIACGAISGGLLVLDVDSDEGLASLQYLYKKGWIPLDAVTNRGHVYLRVPEGTPIPRRRIRLEPGLDILGEGGYVIAPPSWHPDEDEVGDYAWETDPEELPFAPQPLLQWLRENAGPKAKKAGSGAEKGSGDAIPVGQRNNTLASYAGRLRRDGLKATEIEGALQEMNRGRCSPPLSEEEVATIASSIGRYATAEQRREQYAGLARALGVNGKSKLEWLKRHTLIAIEGVVYAFDFETGEYAFPVRQRDTLFTHLQDVLRSAPEDIELTYETKKGDVKDKPLSRIFKEYSVVARDVIGDMMLNRSYFDHETGIFYEALARKRVRGSRFDPDIDEWLRILGGGAYHNLCRWIAGVPYLKGNLPVLYLSGASGAGKGLLAKGLARLWHEGPPTSFEKSAAATFNSHIARCPLLWIDEGFGKRSIDASAIVRSWIGNNTFELHKKFREPQTVKGCVRLIICANNDNVLSFPDSELGADDLKAIIKRFFYVKVDDKATKWLEEHEHLLKDWVEGDGIARHCLALQEQHGFTDEMGGVGARFLLKADETSMHRKLVMQGEHDALVFEWIAKFATDPSQVYGFYAKRTGRSEQLPRAQIGEDQILINVSAVVDCWKQYTLSDPTQRLTVKRIGNTLKKLGPGQFQSRRFNRLRYYRINTDLVLEWVADNQIGSEKKINKNLEAKLKEYYGEDDDDESDE